MVPPLDREEMADGIFQEVLIDQDGNEVPEEDEDNEITKQARDMRKLDQYPHDIIRLQCEMDQLVQQAAARNRAEQTQQAVRQAECERERLVREIQRLQRVGAAGIVQPGGNVSIPKHPSKRETQSYMTLALR